MDRIGPAGGSPTIALTNGQQGFVDENLAAGQEGTLTNAAFLNAVQEELMSILAAAETAPNIATFNQVLTSIQTIIGNQVPGIISGQVPGIVNTNVPGIVDAIFNCVANAAGFYFAVPQQSGGAPLLIMGGRCNFPANQDSISQLLPISFPNYFIGGVVVDANGVAVDAALSYGVSNGPDLSHVYIQCPFHQLIQGSITTRGTASGFYLVWGT